MMRSLLLATVAALAAPLAAQTAPVEKSAPQPLPIVDTIPAPVDAPWPGTIRLEVDATDTEQGIFRVREAIPVAKAGPLVLMLPKWLPGNHAPRGEIEKITGLKISADGKPLRWTRDDVDVFAFHVDVPAGAKEVVAEFQFASATKGDQGRIVMAPNLISLQFQSVSLYPAGHFTRQIPIAATVKYPEGWKAASGLPSSASGSTYTYQTTDYETLIDSPALAGRFCKLWALSPKVDMHVCADNQAELDAAKPEHIDAHKALVTQGVKMFGAEHYDRYMFLLSLSDELGGIGIEHHRSSENGVRTGYFTDWATKQGDRDLLPHEYAHSWVGKYRRGADIWTPDFRTPMRDNLLWAYEGLDQFAGYVLGARSGMLSKQDTLDSYAQLMATLDNRPARQWRDLLDTTHDPIISARRPKGWTSWQRSEDYYNEGLLVWMEVDSIIRTKSAGKKSIDDFLRAFYGMRDGDWGVLTFTFDDIVKALNDVQPHDWATMLETRLRGLGARAPLDGFTANGYRLVYTDTPTDVFKNDEKARGTADHSFSIGLVMAKDGAISQVIWDSPAFAAGLDNGTSIIAVNGMAYSDARLKAAITEAKDKTDPIRLIVKSGDRIRDVAIDYHGGLRYPRLEKIGKGEAGLDRLLAPK